MAIENTCKYNLRHLDKVLLEAFIIFFQRKIGNEIAQTRH